MAAGSYRLDGGAGRPAAARVCPGFPRGAPDAHGRTARAVVP
jgi:hypothetical protein